MTSQQALIRLLAVPADLIERQSGYVSVSSLIKKHMVRDRSEGNAPIPRTEPAEIEIKLGDDLHQAIDTHINNEIRQWAHMDAEEALFQERLVEAEHESRLLLNQSFYMGASIGRAEYLYQTNKWRLERKARLMARPFVEIRPTDPGVLDAEKSVEYGQYVAFRLAFFKERPTFYPVATELTICSPRYSLIGRVDALFADDDGRVIIMDWKRSRAPGCDSKVGAMPATGILSSMPNNTCGRRLAQLNLYREILVENGIEVVDLMTIVFHPGLGPRNYSRTRYPFRAIFRPEV